MRCQKVAGWGRLFWQKNHVLGRNTLSLAVFKIERPIGSGAVVLAAEAQLTGSSVNRGSASLQFEKDADRSLIHGVRAAMRHAFPRRQYARRALVETVFSTVKRKLSARAPGRSLFMQLRQALLLGLAYNLYRL